MRRSDLALVLAGLALVACGGGAPNGDALNGGAPNGGALNGGALNGGALNGGGASAAGQPHGNPLDQAPTFTAEERATLASLSPKSLPRPGPDLSNRFADDARAASLGQKLFFERRFAGPLLDGDNDGTPSTLGVKRETGKVACSDCHLPEAGFSDNRTLGKQVSLGAGWGARRAPSLLDIGQASLLMWDGRHDTLYNQVFGPLESPLEMNSSRLYVAQQMFALYRTEYEAIFGALPDFSDAARFPPLSAAATGCTPSTFAPTATCNGTTHGQPGDGAEYDTLAVADQQAVTQVVVNIGKAIGAYERLLPCGPGRFDQWMSGDADALTASEQRGAQLFAGRGKCATCHSGPFLSDQKFHNVGLKPTVVAVIVLDQDDHGAAKGLSAAIADPLNVRGPFSDGDDGRLPTAVDASMSGAFRTPTLRCVKQRPTFMHTGQLGTLDQVVAFFSRGGDVFGYIGKSEIAALDLSAQDQQDLVAFLGTLEGAGPDARLLSPPAR